jgi:hypothetical protein
MDEVAREDREEKLTTCKVETKSDLAQLEEAIRKTQDSRAETNAEHYQISQTKEGSLEVTIVYTEPDFQKARLIQRREREAVIEIHTTSKGLDVRHTQTERANEILAHILTELTPANSPKAPVRQTIELSGVKDHKKRTQFFLNLFSGMKGFRLREVRDLKVDRSVVEDNEPGAEDSEEEAKAEAKQQLKALVRKVALSGENILVSPQYQQLAKDGFFISKAVWTSTENAGKARLFEFEAEFKDAESATNFAYQIRGVYERNDDGELVKGKSAVGEAEKNLLKSCLEAAAYDSVEQVSAQQTKENSL